MEGKKQRQISVKIDHKEPVKVNKENFTTKLKNTMKRYEKIEEMAGRPIDEILLENLQLKNRRGDMAYQIQKLNDSMNKTNNILHQLLDIEITMNPEIAKPIADEFEVNKKNEYARKNLDSIEVVAEALRKIRYYYHPSLQEWMGIVQKAEQDVNFFKTRNEQLEQENKRLMKRMKGMEEREQERTKKITGKGIKIIVNEQVKTPIASKIEPFINEEPILEVNEDNIAEMEMPIMNEESVETTIEPIDEIPVVQTSASVQKKAEMKEKQEVIVPIVSEESDAVVEDKPRGKELDITYYEPQDKKIIDELQKPKYMMLLDKKGYNYKPSDYPQYDVMIEKKTGKVPLLYIDYLIKQSEIFDEIMQKTDQIYFLFDTKENMKKGNAKFASWLLKSKEKRKTVKFSFTTIDELKVSGLDELDSL